MKGGIRSLNRLTDLKIRSFMSKGEGKLFDGGGLFLTKTKAGTPVWRIKYRIGGVERLYTIGAYPENSLDDARQARSDIRELVRQGFDPVQSRRLEKQKRWAQSKNTFAALSEEWLEKQKKSWSTIHYEKSSRAIERDIIPSLGKLPVSGITPAMVAAAIKKVSSRGADETAGRILQHVNGIFRLAQAHGLRNDNPATPVREVLPAKRDTNNRPAVLKFPELGDILRLAESANLSPAVRLAHRLCAFSAARISNIVEAKWSEFDLDTDMPTWVIPRKQMKVRGRKHDHRIILGPTITQELKEWRIVIGTKGYVFPSPAGEGHITREALEKAYRVTLKLNGRHSPHSWRASFSTLAKDNGMARDAVELALDHIHENEVARAYDRGERLMQRTKLANWWDTQLTQAQHGAQVFELRA